MSSKISYISDDDDDGEMGENTYSKNTRAGEKFENKPQQGTSRREEEELDTFAKLLNEQMKLNKLQGSILACDLELLRSAIEDYDEAGEAGRYVDDEEEEEDEEEGVVTSRKGRAPDELRKAKRLLATIDSHREALKKACESKDRDAIVASLDRLRSSRLDRFLRGPMKAASELAEALDTREVRMPILAMDKKTMCEIRSYAKPSPLVHRVMQAALLLLGEDEGTTEMWSKVQNFCSPDGPKGMNRRLMTFNPDNLHEFTVQRAFDLLKVIRLADVQRASPGAATFYVWAMGVLKKKGCAWDDQSAPAGDSANTPGQKATKKVNIDQIVRKEVEIFAEARRASQERKTPTKPNQKKGGDHRKFYA